MKRRLAPNVEMNDLKNELLLYDPGPDSVHVLNATGRFILNAHLEGRSVEEIESLLKDAYALDPERDLKDEIRKFLADLEAKKLLGPA